MAAGKEELKALVGDSGLVHLVLGGLRNFEQVRLGGEGLLAAQPVDRAVSRRGH
jgi:hypothetical protein